MIRPGEPVTPEIAQAVLHQTFFNEVRYDLSSIGRMKINQRHMLDIPEDRVTLNKG